METFCRIPMQPPPFELKLKTFQLLHCCDHFVFSSKFRRLVPYVHASDFCGKIKVQIC